MQGELEVGIVVVYAIMTIERVRAPVGNGEIFCYQKLQKQLL